MLGSLILDTVTRAAFPTVMTFSLYLLFAGHNAPGGGFVGGLVAGCALILRYAGRGVLGVRHLLPEVLTFERLLGAGLLLAGLTGLTPMIVAGDPFLTSAYWEFTTPVLGKGSIASVLFFDIGVYLIVLGLALGGVELLGPDRPIDEVGGDELPERPVRAGDRPAPGEGPMEKAVL